MKTEIVGQKYYCHTQIMSPKKKFIIDFNQQDF